MSGRLRKQQKDRGGVWRMPPFTFARAARAAWPAALGLTLTLAACAAPVRPSPAGSASQASAGPAGPAFGTVAAVRPVTLSAGGLGDGPATQILTAMGAAAPGVAAPGAPAASAEIVVQTDDGETLSVMQSAGAGLTPGARVKIVSGVMPRLEPVAAAAPAS